MKHQNRILTGTLSIALALSLTSPAAFAATLEFSDVPTTHWAHSSIVRMVEQGVMQGVGNDRFAPEQTITVAEFVTMLVRQFWPDEVSDEAGEHWYDPYVAVAEKHRIILHISQDWDEPLERGNAAVLVHDAIEKGDDRFIRYPAETEATLAVKEELKNTPDGARWYGGMDSDWIARVVHAGIMTGVDDKGTFNAYGTMTRAQAGAIMDRIIAYCADVPAYPTGETDEVVYVTSEEQDFLKLGSLSSVKNGTFELLERNHITAGQSNGGIVLLMSDMLRDAKLLATSYFDGTYQSKYCTVKGTATALLNDAQLGFYSYKLEGITQEILDNEYFKYGDNEFRWKQLNNFWRSKVVISEESITIPAGETVSFSFTIPTDAYYVGLSRTDDADVWISNLQLVKSGTY